MVALLEQERTQHPVQPKFRIHGLCGPVGQLQYELRVPGATERNRNAEGGLAPEAPPRSTVLEQVQPGQPGGTACDQHSRRRADIRRALVDTFERGTAEHSSDKHRSIEQFTGIGVR